MAKTTGPARSSRGKAPSAAGPCPPGSTASPPRASASRTRAAEASTAALCDTDCQDVCPLIGREVGEALRLLGAPASKVAAVAVSVDPEHDTSAAVRAWLRRLRLPANFHYLVGTRQELEPVWRAYFAAPQPLGVRESKHTASIWLIDARGRLRTKFSGGVPVPPRDIAHDLRVLLREAARAPA
jgi:protein SCO1/2